jgi:hypothetical protein
MTNFQSFSIYLPEPTVDIAGQSNFGKFTELDIVSRRQNI